MNEKIVLPPEMEADRALLEKTQRNLIRISTQEPKSSLSVHTSKMGGKPYFPLNQKYPYNKDGKPLYMVAQINFSDIFQNPEISRQISEDTYLKHLPSKGILSFFIDYHHDLWGSNFGDMDEPSSYKVLYFPEVEKDEALLIKDFSFLASDAPNFMPVLENDQELAFDFTLEKQLVALDCYEWEAVFDQYSYDYVEELQYSDGRSSDDIYDEYGSGSGGHQIGGYPLFTQTDPRSDRESLRVYDFLLLQLDSDDYIMWGDCGVANFFINFEKLKQLDFSDVFFNWDCC